MAGVCGPPTRDVRSPAPGRTENDREFPRVASGAQSLATNSALAVAPPPRRHQAERTAAGIALGVAILNYVLGVTLPETPPDLGVLPSIRLGTLAKAVGLGVVAVALALLTARRVRRTDVPSTLRVVE